MTVLPPTSPHFGDRPDQEGQSESDPDLLSPPITGHDCQDHYESHGLDRATHQSSELMTRIFQISQISGQKEDTAATKCTRGPIFQIAQFPKPDVPTPGQELGHESTHRGPKK